MKNIKLIFILMLGFLLLACSQPDSYDSQKKPIKMSEYKGKWVVVNYWAAWCKPCLTEMPELSRLYVNAQNNIMVLGVNYDQASNEDMNNFAAQHHITFPLLQNFPMEKFGINHIETLPVTFIFDPSGKLKTTLHGPQTEQSILAVTGKNSG